MEKPRIGVLGSGMVGQVLASGFLKYGHSVMIGTRTPSKVEDWLDKNSGGQVGSQAQTAAFAEVIVLASKGSAAELALDLCKAEDLVGKIIIDATNPIADVPPQNGVLRYYTSLDRSQMEILQQKVPAARFVKAFNCVGSGYMIDPGFKDKPSMFICGNDTEAKKVVSGFLETFGWIPEDMGSVEAARAIEPLHMLWTLPGYTRNQWDHAFKLVKA